MRAIETVAGVFLGVLIILATPVLSHAHGNAGDSGLISGLTHPVFGPDHLIAMVTVGLLSAQIGGRAIWSVPLTFVMVMAVGGVLGMKGVDLPFVEYGIALSVVALGIALATEKKMPVIIAMVFVGMFAIFHGHAHGTEMPNIAEPAMYALGFSSATAGLHILGAVTGYTAVRRSYGAGLLRFTGMLIVASGAYFVIQIYGRPQDHP